MSKIDAIRQGIEYWRSVYYDYGSHVSGDPDKDRFARQEAGYAKSKIKELEAELVKAIDEGRGMSATATKSEKGKEMKCNKCQTEMFFDNERGPIVGGLLRFGVVGRGAHHIGAWSCPNCDDNFVSVKQHNQLTEFTKKIADKTK